MAGNTSSYNTVTIKGSGPIRKLAAVTPSDDTEIGCRALYIGTTGNLSLIAVGDSSAVTISNVPAGSVLPIACAKVMAATTASNIVALF